MKEWYLNTPAPNICSGYESDEIEEYAVNNFSDVMYTTFSDSIVKRNNDGTIVTTVSVIIQGVVEDNVTSTTKRQLLCSIGSFECGDYVYFENNYWIVVAKPSNNKIYEKALVEICNYTLTFQNSTGTILSYPCVKETSSSVGIDEGSVINIPDGTVTIKLPFDSETVKLDVDDRFFIDDLSVDTPQVYAISHPDRTTYKYGSKGLIKLTMKQNQYNPLTDRKDLSICDYFTPSSTPTTGTYAKIIVSGSLTIGTSRTLTAKFYESDGTENTSITANWTINRPTGLESYFDVDIDGSTCKITITDDDYITVDSVVSIKVDDGSGGYIGTKSMTVTA